MDQPRAEEGGVEGGIVGLQELAKTDRVLVQQVINTRICLCTLRTPAHYSACRVLGEQLRMLRLRGGE